MNKLIAALVLLAALPGNAWAGTAGPVQEVSLTVYNDNLALIRELRPLDLAQGQQTLVLEDVSGQLQPQTVHLATEGVQVTVLEQNYDYDLVSREKLLERFIGKTITLHDDYQKTDIVGKLLSVGYGTILEVDGQILIDPPGRIILPPGAADDLLLRPTLSWLVNSASAGQTLGEISYLSGGLSWDADYVLVLNPDDTRGSLEGWVTLSNYSGTTYNNASLKLVAGEVNRVRDEMQYAMKGGAPMAEASMADGFVEEQLFEYHLYDLQRRTTIKTSQQKQVGLLSAEGVKTKKILNFNGISGGDVQVNIEFNNSEENGLGLPMPAGTVRVMKADSEGELQFIGENNIQHTPRKENVRLFIGNAFDVKGEVVQTDYKDLGSGYNIAGGYTASYKVTLKNRKLDGAVTVNVPVTVYGDWTMTAASAEYKEKDAWTKEFTIELPADSEKEFTYSIRVVYR
jgi:hypothetical protein